MSDKRNPGSDPDAPVVYQLRIRGHLGPEWKDWFCGLTIRPDENGETLLTGPVTDQAALHGLLKKIRDLGVPLLSINPVETGQADASESNGQSNSQFSE